MADEVRLPDLEVIRRYSIAVRRERAPLDEVVEALRADLAAITGAGKPSSARRSSTARRPKPAASGSSSRGRSARGRSRR